MKEPFILTPVALLTIVGLLLGGCETGPSLRDGAAPAETNQQVQGQKGSYPATTPSHVPEGSGSDGEHQKAEGISHKKAFVPKVPTGACPPAWWKRHESPLFIEGIGGPAEGREAAEGQARVDVAKTLDVGIEGQDTIHEKETSGRGFEFSVESTLVERVDLTLAGLAIVKTEVCGDQWFAQAKLDRAKAENAWRDAFTQLESEADVFRAHITTHTQNRAAFPLLLAQYRLTVTLETASQIQQRLPRLTGKQETTQPLAGAVKDTKQQYESLLRSLQVKRFGDNQQAVHGRLLAEPLVLQVLAGEIPVVGVPVQFSVTQGQIDVSSIVHTGGNGKAKVTGRYPRKTDESARVEARVLLEDITQDYPEELKTLLQEHGSRLTAHFQVQPPAFFLVRDKLALASQGETLRANIQSLQAEGDVLGVMEHFVKLHSVQTQWAKVVKILNDRHPASANEGTRLKDPAEIRQEMERLVSSLEFRTVNGNEQHAILNRPLAEPLRVQLVARLGGQVVGVSLLPVQFEFVQGKGEVDRHASTDGQGHASAQVHRVEPGATKQDTEAIIVASLDTTQLGEALPDPWQSRLRAHLHKQTHRFRVTLPRGCTSSSPFDQHLYELACEMVKRTHGEWIGKRTVVRDFVERTTRQRHLLSGKIEEALASGFMLTRQLQVLPPAGNGNSQSEVNNDLEVTGVYERQRDGLFIQASLIPVRQGVAHASGDIVIPQDVLSRIDWGSLARLADPDAPVPVVPDPSDYQSYEEWTTGFLQHHNPEASFGTEVRPKNTSYQDGENAVFQIKTEKDCYLWVFNIGASGNGALLLPNKFQSNSEDTKIFASQGWVDIPSPAANFELPIGPPFGNERIKTFCTTRPVPILPNHLFKDLRAQLPLFIFSRNDRRFRDIGVAAKGIVELKPSEWSEANIEVTTLPKGQRQTRGLRGLEEWGLQ